MSSFLLAKGNVALPEKGGVGTDSSPSTCFMSSTFLGRTLRPGASVRSRSNSRLALTCHQVLPSVRISSELQPH